MDDGVNTKSRKTAGSKTEAPSQPSLSWQQATEIMHSVTGLEDIMEWIICPGTFYITTDGYPQARVIPYFQSRTAMNMLDRIFGRQNWHTKWDIIRLGESGFFIKLELSVTLEGKTVTASGESEVGNANTTDPNTVKNLVTDAFKRACVELGMFRQLYFAGPFYAIFHPDGEYEYKPRGSSTPFRWSPPPPDVVAAVVNGTAKQKMQAGVRAYQEQVTALNNDLQEIQELANKGIISQATYKHITTKL